MSIRPKAIYGWPSPSLTIHPTDLCFLNYQDEIAKAKKSENISSSTVPVDPVAYSLMTSLNEALVAKKQEQRQLEEEVMKCSYTAER